APAPLVLETRRAQFTDDGGHRIEFPADTVSRLEHHISPITGIVASLRPLGEVGARTATFVAEHTFVDIHLDPYALHEGLRKRSGGKGARADQARAGAIGEALERYSGVFEGDEPRLWATRTELGEAAIHPNAYMGYSEQQYRTREVWNARGSRVHWVPEPFDDASAIEWTPLWSLMAAEPRYLPTSCCYYGYPGAGARFAAANSNGCAAGNTLEEAILQGFLELVERDGVAIWWYNRLCRPAVDLASFEDPYVDRLLEHYRAMGREIWVLDVTGDLGIPTCAAVSRREGTREQDIVLGFGAHLDARIALLRALTEVSQSLPAVPGRGAAPRYAGSNPEAARWWRTATLEEQPHLRPNTGLAARRRSDYPVLTSGDLRDDVLRCAQIVAGHGMETLVLDQTRPDVGLHVVRVVVPGLRHFWARFGPGRLYDVPVQMGWREAPLDEAELNPWVVYF
ncbi:MAG: YcaO-like family protein, partial [Myxococcales bacterium]|nr:YcaO-like family protein [Myxococcales bacterium]